MTYDRLFYALSLLRHTEWSRFERLASTFLADEFPDLRTMASPSGDGGRDGELFASDQDPSVLLQYSVTPHWDDKIKDTITRLKSTSPNITLLIYVSSQEIGAKADALRKMLRVSHGVSLDIRDRNWLCERVSQSEANRDAAESLAQVIVDPVLSKGSARPGTPLPLSDQGAIVKSCV